MKGKREIKVLLTRKYFSDDIEYIKKNISEHIEIIDPGNYTEDCLMASAGDVQVFWGAFVSTELLNVAKELELIQIPWTGVDNFNFDVVQGRNITVCNSHSNAMCVAEHAMALLLSASRQIPYHDRKMRQGNWCRPKEGDTGEFWPPHMLRDSVVLLWGYGAIGKAFAKLLSGFGVKVNVVDTNKVPEDETVSCSFMSNQSGVALRDADYVCIFMPLTPETTGLIGRESFAVMKNSAYLISTSRGPIIDEKALYDALKSRRICGAAIDTWYNYPKPDEGQTYPSVKFPFHELDNLILSPHRAGFCKGKLPHLDDAIGNLNRLVEQKELINIINMNKRY